MRLLYHALSPYVVQIWRSLFSLLLFLFINTNIYICLRLYRQVLSHSKISKRQQILVMQGFYVLDFANQSSWHEHGQGSNFVRRSYLLLFAEIFLNRLISEYPNIQILIEEYMYFSCSFKRNRKYYLLTINKSCIFKARKKYQK